MDVVKVYGTDWCPDTQVALAVMREHEVDFDYVNVDENEAGDEWVRRHNNGKRKLPTVDVGGLVLSVPNAEKLETVLRERGLVLGD